MEELKKCMYTNEHYTDEDRKVLCEDCEEDCAYARLCELKENIDSMQEEPVSKPQESKVDNDKPKENKSPATT